MKRHCTLILLYILLISLLGCANRDIKSNETLDEKRIVSINQIAMEAENFEFESKSLKINDSIIIIPEKDVKKVQFKVGCFSRYELTEKFKENLKILGCERDISDEDLTLIYSAYDPKSADYVQNEISANDANESEIQDRNGYLAYSDGTYSELLYKTTYMCEMADNKIPVELTGDDEDYSARIWGYRGLELGVFQNKYDIKRANLNDENLNDVYKLYDKYVSIKDAIDFVEKNIKNYNFCGSDLLDYKVDEVTVRKLSEDTYYFQMKVQAVYNGCSLDNDLFSQTEENIGDFATEHIVSMFQSDKLGYIWSSVHSYSEIEYEKAVEKYVSIYDACKIVEENITNKKEFEVDSIELQYKTQFIYDENEEIIAVNCTPVYHFVIKNPMISGYSALYFDVNVEDGNFTMSYKH